MRLTQRDTRLVKDVALSHVLARDHVLRLGYFTSISRANRRLRILVENGYLRIHPTPFFSQSLYWVGPSSRQVVGTHIETMLRGRVGSPRFIQHSLAICEVRLALADRGGEEWRFEGQLWRQFRYGTRRLEIRPDGFILLKGKPTLIEVDLGTVSLAKFKEKITAYSLFAMQRQAATFLHEKGIRILVITTSENRAKNLSGSCTAYSVNLRFMTFKDLGITLFGGWS